MNYTHLTRPERYQISILLKADHKQSEVARIMNRHPSTISRETIYWHIYADKRVGGMLHRALRCQKLRRRRYGGRDRCGTIPNQVSSDLLPAIVDSRRRSGDRETDLMIGAGHRHALVTLNERISLYAMIAHVPAKTAEAVSDAILSLMTPFAASVLT